MNKNKHNIFDVIVIGAGVAGSEAALITSSFGQKTLLINISMDNPSLLKNSPKIKIIYNEYLISRTNALGGFIDTAVYVNKIAQMTEIKDKASEISSIVDKRKFSLFYKYYIENHINLCTRQGIVTELEILPENMIQNHRVKLNDGSMFYSKAVIISTGTFLNGKIFWGNNEYGAGRHGEVNSEVFLKNLKNIGYKFQKEKIFVGPTIDSRTLNLKKLTKEKSQVNTENFKIELEDIKDFCQNTVWQKYYSFKAKGKIGDILKTVEKTGKNYKKDYLEKLVNIRSSKLKSASEEDPDFEIELLPEGDRTNGIYLNGFNFAFSDEEQQRILNKFYGLEDAWIIRPGYCIEYEALKNEQLKQNMESNINCNVYFAGEVNGPEEYNNIALQGIIAGAYASLNFLTNNKLLTKKIYNQIAELIEKVRIDSKYMQTDTGNLKKIILEIKESQRNNFN